MNIDDTAKKQLQQHTDTPADTAQQRGIVAAATHKRAQHESEDDASQITAAKKTKTTAEAGNGASVPNMQAESPANTTSSDSAQQLNTAQKKAKRRWRHDKTELAMMMAGLLPTSLQTYGAPTSIESMRKYLEEEQKDQVPDWYWQQKKADEDNEALRREDLSHGPPYRASYPGMDTPQIEVYLKARKEGAHRISDEEAQQILRKARKLSEDAAGVKDHARNYTLPFADATPTAEWFDVHVAQLKEDIEKLSACRTSTHFQAHVRLATRYALSALYEVRMDGIQPPPGYENRHKFWPPRYTTEARDEDTECYLREAYQVLEDVAKIKDKAVESGCSFVKATPHAHWLKKAKSKLALAQSKLKEIGWDWTFSSRHVQFVVGQAEATVARVIKEGRGYTPSACGTGRGGGSAGSK